MQEFIIPAPASIRAKIAGARDSWIVCDASELPAIAEDRVSQSYRDRFTSEWMGGLGWTRGLEACRVGDNSAVEQSDAMLDEMTKYLPERNRRAYIDDVAGAVPNVPAFIAGHPLSMRRRIQTRDEYAPIAIAYDPTCSSVIKTRDIFKRGIVALALVRALAGVRPVELYVCGGTGMEGDDKTGYWIACRIETAPLDLARAAHYLTHAANVRGIMYGILRNMGSGGGWPYNDHHASISRFTEIVRAALPHVSDVLAIPAIVNSDPLLKDPRGWLDRTMRQLASMDEADAA